MKHLLLVAVGGAIGASLRHLVGLASLKLMGPGFPYGTFVVNVIGSFVMGAFIAWLAARSQADVWLRYLIATGFLGGFTTFSAFSLDAVFLWERGEATTALAYVLLSVMLSIFAVLAGLFLVRALTS